jgi:hypothetical protein
MEAVTKIEFEKMVIIDAKELKRQAKKQGAFWTLEICKEAVREKLKNQYTIIK